VAPAALPSQARAAEEIAAVFRNVTEDRQRYCIKTRVALSEEDLSTIEGLIVEDQQVREIRSYVARTKPRSVKTTASSCHA
jgi:hypothetical protein